MKLDFRSKIYIGLVSLLVLLGVVICLVVSRIMTEALLEENRNRGISIGTNLAARATEPILAIDFLRMKTLVDETVGRSDDIFYTFILDAEGDILVHSFKGGFPTALQTVNPVTHGAPYSIRLLDSGRHLIYDYAVPVMIDRNRFGVVRVGLLRTKIQQAINRLILSTVLATGAVVFIAAVLGGLFARRFTGRIRILHQASEQAMAGNLNVQAAPLLKKNCWDIMACDRTECPAYGKFHHRCWYLAGTQCPTCVEGEYAKKIASCRQCKVYRQCSGDEIQSLAESFDSMVLSLNGHLSDLTLAQKTLTEQRHLLRTILDATPDYVALQDSRLIYRTANKAFCDMLAKDETQIIGRTHHDLFSAPLADRYQQEDRQVLTSGQILVKENHMHAGEEEKWLHVMKIPVRADDDRIVGLLCNCRDITDRKKMQQQLNQAQKMETVGELTAGIAHEINTPLGIILGYAQLLLEDVAPDVQIFQDLKIIEKQTKVCRKIVADLLAFSRHTESAVQQVDINRCLTEIIAVVEHTFKLDQVDILTDLDDNLPLVEGDPEQLKQVFANLLSNARDAIGTGGTIRAKTVGDARRQEVTVYLADTGTGIPADRIDRIFDPFFTTKPVGKGTGLGLSVTFGIVKEHGGRIEVESPPVSLPQDDQALNRGTLFIIHLPVNGIIGNKEKQHGDDSGPG